MDGTYEISIQRIQHKKDSRREREQVLSLSSARTRRESRRIERELSSVSGMKKDHVRLEETRLRLNNPRRS